MSLETHRRPNTKEKLRALVRELTRSAFVPSDSLIELIAGAYAEPWRAYHDVEHVLEVLERAREVDRGPGWRRPVEVCLAILFHDVVYRPSRRDNEERSAQMARDVLSTQAIETALALQVDVERVAELIELTARHGSLTVADVDEDAAHFLDCDMAILGAPPERFARYEEGVRQEHAGVPGVLYRRGRSRFLKKVLAKERIFLSEHFHQSLDAAARGNVRGALAT